MGLDSRTEVLASQIARRLAARASRASRDNLAFAEGIARAGAEVSRVLEAGGTVFAAGNGGSATQSQHLTSELVGRFRDDRRGLRAISLTGEPAVLTAIGNDFGFDQIFARQIEALAGSDDLFIAFSTSGRSRNLLVAADLARERGLVVVGMTADGSELGDRCHVVVNVPPGSTASIQEDHLVALHLICEIVESEIFGRSCGPEELFGLVNSDEVLEQRERWRTEGRAVAWTSGCFDLFHQGHLLAIESAAAEADALIVGLNTDSSVRRIKGDDRPLVPEMERAQILSSMRMVDLVVLVDDDEPSEVLQRLQPDVYCKGSDYEDGAKPMPEKSVVEAYGGRVVFSPLVSGISTSSRARQIALSRSNKKT